MAAVAAKKWDVEGFLDWCTRQEGRFELVDGVVVAMAGATRRHDQIVVNILTGLVSRLRGKPCRAHTADFAVRTRERTIRRPDVLVDCKPGENDSLEALGPTAVFEVLSPSPRQTDLVRKLDEYRDLAGLRHVVLIEQGVASVVAYARASDEAPWTLSEYDGVESDIELDALGVRLPMAEVYADVEFDPEDGPDR
jgi:Uma2 family endonuclease